MFSRISWIIGILVVSVVLMPVVGFAAEHGGSTVGKEHGGTTAAAPDAQQQANAAPAAAAAPTPTMAATPAAPPALKPIMITFSGDLAAVDANAAPAMVTVQDRYGVRKEISVPTEAKISQGTNAKALADLKVGDKLTVEYTYDVATGKRTAQSISIGEAAPAAAGQ